MNTLYSFFIFTSVLIVSCFVTKTMCAGEFVNYSGPKSEILAYEAMEKYGYEQAKKNNLLLHNIAPNILDGKAVFYGIWFISYEKDNLEKGRMLAGNLIDSFFTLLSKDKRVIDHFSEIKKRRYMKPYDLLDATTMRIAYWDENIDRPKEPALAEIRFYDRRMHYYVADPKTQALQLVYEESFDDAVAFAACHKKKEF